MDIDKTLEDVKQKVRQEKNRDLRPLPSDFYDVAAQAIKSLEAEMVRIGRPRSVEYKMLEDELSGLVTDVETVFMKRVGKVVERATSGAFTNSHAALMRRDVDKLLPAEQELYEDVLKAIIKARTALIADFIDTDHGGEKESFSGLTEKTEKEKTGTEKTETEKTIQKTEPSFELKKETNTKTDTDTNTKTDMENDAEFKTASSQSSTTLINENYILVRILKDLPEFMGEDKRSYHLKSQDVVSLPSANANLLIKRGVAQHARNLPGSSEGNPES
jgi:DNA replication factor GINS